jgi:hypothetical protein
LRRRALLCLHAGLTELANQTICVARGFLRLLHFRRGSASSVGSLSPEPSSSAASRSSSHAGSVAAPRHVRIRGVTAFPRPGGVSSRKPRRLSKSASGRFAPTLEITLLPLRRRDRFILRPTNSKRHLLRKRTCRPQAAKKKKLRGGELGSAAGALAHATRSTREQTIFEYKYDHIKRSEQRGAPTKHVHVYNMPVAL